MRNYPGLTTAQYETLKSKITTEQQKQREEAAKTPQEKYEEYKTETLVPYLTETVGLMGTIGPEMKPPEKVEDYYSWQEESLDPWSSKVRKKEGEISQKKYETYKGETLIPFLRETGATIRPPHELSAFQKWEESTFSPWIKDYETTQTAAQIAYLAFEQCIEEEQLFIEEQVLLQLQLEINLEFPASLENEMLSDNKKDGDTSTQPNETTAGEGQ